MASYFIEHDKRVTGSGIACKPSGLDAYAEFTDSRHVVGAYEAAVTARTADVPYFFHADHLGSGSMITDGRGNPYQTLAYAPYGEELLDVRSGSYNEPHQFTGHERDQETGLNYAHARYYWSDLSIFTSMDPLAEKKPWL